MPWTKTQKREFGVMLLSMGELYETPVSDARAEMFLRTVEDLPFEAVKVAAAQHLRGSKFFPKPADLVELVEGNADDKGELAWQWVPREVRRVGYTGTPTWPDEPTKRAALGLFGGSWRTLCERLPAEGPELLGYRKQFIALYGALSRKEAMGELPPGRDEARELLDAVRRRLAAEKAP